MGNGTKETKIKVEFNKMTDLPKNAPKLTQKQPLEPQSKPGPKIDPIRKQRVKQAKYEGKTDTQALIEGGCAKATAEHNTGPKNTLLNTVKDEILQEIKQEGLSVGVIIQRLDEDRELARKKQDIATMTRCDELLGKHLAMFTDKIDQKVTQEPLEPQEAGQMEDTLAYAKRHNLF